MITKINIKGVACYKEMATLETDKNVNLIYGITYVLWRVLFEALDRFNAEW